MNIETTDFQASFGPTGNLVRLFFKPVSCDVFHWCGDEDELLAHPQYYGVPLLFPPNRTENGQFLFQGRTYRLPVNDPVNGFNVHGFLLDKRPASVVREGNDVTVRTVWDPACPGFSGFPHTFEIVRIFRFGQAAVRMETEIVNHSHEAMPCGIGFHTAFAAPEEEAVFIRVPHDGRYWRVDRARRLPDGTFDELTPETRAVLEGKAQVRSTALGALFSAPPEGARFAVVRRNADIVFSADKNFPFFAVWNAEGRREMVCIEPMSWFTNAPNLPLLREQTGVRALPPGEKLRFVMSLEIFPGKDACKSGSTTEKTYSSTKS